MVRKLLLAILAVFAGSGMAEAQTTASFSASETGNAYYSNGFDSQEEIDRWTWTVNDSIGSWGTWRRATAEYVPDQTNTPVDNFKLIHEQSRSCMGISADRPRTQDERGVSEPITVQPGSHLSVWVCYGIYNLGKSFDATITISEAGSTDTTTVFQASQYHQTNTNYQQYHWRNIDYDLSAFAGKTITIAMHYWGTDGDAVLVNDLSVYVPREDGLATINQGGNVHFTMTTNARVLPIYSWEFPGGTPSTSSIMYPSVNYEKEGRYDVRLTVTDARTGQVVTSKEGFVNVVVATPEARIGYPDSIYFKVDGGCVVPVGGTYTFNDASSNYPTEWAWSFPEATVSDATAEKPVVTFPKAGTYSVGLTVSNKAGSDAASISDIISAGDEGDHYVWNIRETERNQVTNYIYGSSQGYFPGSTTRRITRFAEKFGAPQAEAVISKVGVYFARTETYQPDSQIVVSIAKVDKNGLPGELLARSIVLRKDLKLAEAGKSNEENLTDFVFDQPVTINEPFFVVIDSIPAYTLSRNSHTPNAIGIGASPIRSEGDINSLYVYQDSLAYIPGYNFPFFTNNYQWTQLENQPIAMAVAPYLHFTGAAATGISNIAVSRPEGKEAYFDLSGRRLQAAPRQGLYIRRNADGTVDKLLAE